MSSVRNASNHDFGGDAVIGTDTRGCDRGMESWHGMLDRIVGYRSET